MGILARPRNALALLGPDYRRSRDHAPALHGIEPARRVDSRRAHHYPGRSERDHENVARESPPPPPAAWTSATPIGPKTEGPSALPSSPPPGTPPAPAPPRRRYPPA